MRKHLFFLLVFLCPLLVFSQVVGNGSQVVDNGSAAKLTVQGDFSDPLIPGTTSNGLLRVAPTANEALVIGKKSGGTKDAWLQAGFSEGIRTITDPISLQPLGGNVGMGLLSPSAKLEVEGEIKADSLDVQSGLIKNVADPISAQDVATKAYVDALYTIGYSAEQGGYIFWVSADGKHGLVAETQDQTTSTTWHEAKDIISNPSNYSAVGADFRDWRLPTKFELNEMYLQKDDIGGFDDDNDASTRYYWSSTELNRSQAWNQDFSIPVDGPFGQFAIDKYVIVRRIRAVRSF